ncbi:MAG: hypothetical protein WC208_13535 [Gallionella sp.]|jgi:F0F1-type ATP synthase membrane subunit b/b'
MSNFLKPSDVLKLEAQRYAAMSNAALELDKLCTQTIAEANTRASEIVEQAEVEAKNIVERATGFAKEQVDAISESLSNLEEQKRKLTAEVESMQRRAQKSKPRKEPKSVSGAAE